ncbi:alanyl-tRNA synthetase [Tessaracoccus bendigoensis DSM 12906]|uniref:Alanine--tRNA ligase n=1 Tax=Tessaracoccus bendigoensis DSM 12906 TaxID=1123357 RepID=A0A1M6MLT7_9ACTN|nr:alanine--tRNA ligase [Tessaracoccus bendigoensis]SHJ84422.1 alanyl-tRNA synthetase [Tessaracoccus bendigoensis DSM 12906]
MKTAEIRSRFIDFFVKHQHVDVPSASLLYNDPTLLFVNAGMVPFKPYFLGDEPAPYDRAVSAQKCVRTLDIEEVGKTTRHGTFFQMLGNFSFGDYFKEGAITYAWEFVTGSEEDGCLGFDPETVWVTALHGDQETIDLWQKVGIPRERIQERGLKDNYWHMGVPGPGGPCSEIYIDRGPGFGADGGPEADEDRFLEIWNLVFQQEELSAVRAKDDFDVARQLPSRNIDTGAGLERIALLKQNVANMYEIDEVYPVIQKAAELSGKRYGDDHTDDIRFRVVADHVRSSLMLMTDGVTPGNEARGYVLRRLLRRVIRSMRLLGVSAPVLLELLPVSRDLMRVSYPDIDAAWPRVAEAAEAEEKSFRRTLQSGTVLFDSAVDDARSEHVTTLPGDQAFRLHDTFGFPIDLTMEMAAEQGLTVDRARFDALMKEQKERARADAKSKKGGAASLEAYRELREAGEVPFLGYTDLDVSTRVRGIVADGVVVDRALDGATVDIVLQETPFYAESGGQDADRGVIRGDGFSLNVIDVQRPVPGLVVHRVEVLGELPVGASVDARVDGIARHGSCQAHTATHIVHAALRELVGPTATQAGSYNKPGYMRFDFSSTHGLSDQLKAEIEGRSNEAIADNFAVTAQEMKLEDAKALGAMAMFGEKYPPIVRMVELAGPWSRELCGGTHVATTAEIGMLNLLSESSIGSGVRRVEALVAADAFSKFAAERALVSTLTDTLRVQPDQLVGRVERLVTQLKDAEKQIARLNAEKLLASSATLVEQAETVGGVRYLGVSTPGVAGGDLRTLVLDLRERLGSGPAVVALIGGSDKPTAVVATNEAARGLGLRAGQLIGLASAALGGKGGGKDDLAQGGGTDPAAAPMALAAVRSALDSRG